MSDAGVKLLEEPSGEAARGLNGVCDDVTGDMPTDKKCLSDSGGPACTGEGHPLPSLEN